MGRPLNLWERCCLTSFVDHGHEITLFSYDPVDLPPGVRSVPARAVLTEDERDEFFQIAPGRISQFSDLFRFELLRQRGGWWIDTDVVCLGEQLPAGDITVGFETADYVGSAIMRFPAGHPLLVEAVAFAQANRESDIWAFSGPILLTRLVAEYGLSPHALRVLYPFDYVQIYDVLDPDRRAQAAEIAAGSPFLHLWHHAVRSAGIHQDFLPPAGSFLGDLFRRHGGAGAAEVDPGVYRGHLHAVRQVFELRRQNTALKAELDRIRR